MKYSEFKAKMKELELKADLIDSNDGYMLVQCNGYEVATVSKDRINTIDTDYQTWKELEVWERKILFDYLVLLAKTPLEDRKDKMKYNVVACRLKRGSKNHIEEQTLFYGRFIDCLGVGGSNHNGDAEQQWTLQQIHEWGLESCERIEVKD